MAFHNNIDGTSHIIHKNVLTPQNHASKNIIYPKLTNHSPVNLTYQYTTFVRSTAESLNLQRDQIRRN